MTFHDCTQLPSLLEQTDFGTSQPLHPHTGTLAGLHAAGPNGRHIYYTLCAVVFLFSQQADKQCLCAL